MAHGSAHVRLQLDLQEKLVRAIVQEEIVKAFRAFGREAAHLDMPYETGELESSALSAIGKVVEGTVARLTCPHDEYPLWNDRGCSRCGEPEPAPVNPFEGDGPEAGTKTRTCPVAPDICGDITGWEAFLRHIQLTHTSADRTEEQRWSDVQKILEGKRS